MIEAGAGRQPSADFDFKTAGGDFVHYACQPKGLGTDEARIHLVFASSVCIWAQSLARLEHLVWLGELDEYRCPSWPGK